MLVNQILNRLTEDQKKAITRIMTTCPEDGCSEHGKYEVYIKAYADAFNKANGEEQTDIIPHYIRLRALVALCWARTFDRHFEGGDRNLALKVRLAYDLLHPEPRPQDLFAAILEQTTAWYNNLRVETKMALLIPFNLALYGSITLFAATGILLGFGATIPSASIIFAVTTTVSLISFAILKGIIELYNSEYNIPRQYQYEEEQSFFRYSTLKNYSMLTDSECIDSGRKDRHTRPFDELGFFSRSDEKISFFDIETKLKPKAPALTSTS